MEGHLRSIVGRLTVEEIVRDRAKVGLSVGGEGSSPLHRLAGTVPATMFNLVQSARALGLDVTALLGKLGVEGEKQNE